MVNGHGNYRGAPSPREKGVTGVPKVRPGVKWRDQMRREQEKSDEKWSGRKRRRMKRPKPRVPTAAGCKLVARGGGATPRVASRRATDAERPAPKASGGESWRTQFPTDRREGVTVFVVVGRESPANHFAEEPRDHTGLPKSHEASFRSIFVWSSAHRASPGCARSKILQLRARKPRGPRCRIRFTID